MKRGCGRMSYAGWAQQQQQPAPAARHVPRLTFADPGVTWHCSQLSTPSTRTRSLEMRVRPLFEPVRLQHRTVAVNATLLALAADSSCGRGTRRCCLVPGAVQGRAVRGAQQQTRCSTLLRPTTVDRWDRQTDGHRTVTYRLCRILCGHCQHGSRRQPSLRCCRW